MIEGLPHYIELLFGLTVLVTIAWFYVASKSLFFLIIAVVWTVIQSLLGLNGFYQNTMAIPPRILLFGVLPSLLFIGFTFLSTTGKNFIDRIDLKTLTYFHSIRILVEIVLLLLFYQELVSVYMTFEGTNFDMFSGLTAPWIAYLAFRKNKKNKNMLLGWNIVCLLLLLNVVVTAVFAIPSPFQKLAFDQPNRAVLYFPFNLLPTVIVPIVLFGHLVAFRQLATKK